MLNVIIIDTNVLVSALRSRRGASHVLLTSIGTGLFQHAVSTTLVLEYEDVLLRDRSNSGLSIIDIQVVIDYVTGTALRQPIQYRWRPYLKDAGDDHLLELAVAAGAETIVTYNQKDFAGVEKGFSIQILNAFEFLKVKGVLS